MTSATSDAVATTGARHNKHRRATTRGVSALMYASQQGDVERVRKIIREQSATLLTRDRTGKTPLHYCCSSDNICAAQAADLLVMAAPDLVESHDEDGFTPLHLAVIAGNMPLVTFLLANKADVNAVDNEKHTVVHWATVCGETAALRAVLAAGAPVSTPDVHGGYPLHYAAQMCGGDRDSNLGLQVLQTLLTHSDIVVSVEDGDGRQPLLWAASAGSAKAVLALIRAGAGIEAPDKDGLTALHCAASRGHTDCIDSLLTLCGASPDVIDSNGCTALHYAVTLGHADATALLLAHGADPNRQDRKGRSPAHCGCAKGQFETVKMIGAHGANLWLRNARGDLPLHEASASGRRDLVRWLLDMRPSQVNARNNDGRCPLHLAALNDNADMCKILLDSGAQINPILRTSKNTFMTPLDCALQRGFRSTAKYLQLHGGVPSNRLGDLRHKQIGSGVNLQIKEDVTFWGDTSSDSERENGDVTKHSKRVQRKKIANKYEKKRASLSGSDLENNKFVGNKMESSRSKRRLGEKNQRIRTAGRTDSATSLIDHSKDGNRKAPSSRIDYSNEVIINGKTEINIHRSIGAEEQILAKASENLAKEVGVQVSADFSMEKDKRPKSAKPSKVKDKSTKLPEKEDSSKRKIKVDKPSSKLIQQKQGTIEQSKESEQIHESITTKSTSESNGNDKNGEVSSDAITKSEIKVTEAKPLPDQQSLMSNTSEDVEENKNLLVEAAVHEPPKHIETSTNETGEPEKDNSQEDTKKTVKQASSDQQQTVTEISESVTKEKSKQGDEVILEAEVTSKTTEEIKTSPKTTEELKTKTEQLLDKSEKENLTLEPTTEKSETKNVTATSEIFGEEIPQEVTASDLKEEVLKTDQPEPLLNEPEAVIASDNRKDPTEEPLATDQVNQNISAKVEEILDQTDTSEATDGKEDQSAAPDLETTKNKNLEEVETKESSKTKIDESQKKKKKKRGQRKKNQAAEKEDQPYEIIYKTIGADENDDSLPQLIQHENDIKFTKSKDKIKHQKSISQSKSSEEENSSDLETDSSSTASTKREHKSFRVLDEQEAEELEKVKSKSRKLSRKSKDSPNHQRSRSEENKKIKDQSKEADKTKKSKMPTALTKNHLSKSDKYLNVPDRKVKSSMESRVPSLPNIDGNKEPPRSESNMSAPLVASIYSDNERGSASDLEEDQRSSGVRRKKIKRRSKTREAKSAGSDYESSNVIDSGFEPSPRSSRIPKWKNMSERGVNMSSVTQSIQSNIRRYHLERKIFQHLLELKRMQIRAGQHNEAILVKRAIDAYHQSCASTVGAGRYVPEDYSFKNFEKFLYLSLRKLQRNGADHLKGLPESGANPLLCTQSTHRCMHATHAYTGIPCAAYLPRMDHHTIPKIGFTSTQCKPGTGFLPTINPKKAVTLELCHGNDKQIISLPADRLDQNKRYYVTFTVKGNENTPPNEETAASGHRHSKSD